MDGVSSPRPTIGTNWILGYSHTSRAQTGFTRGLVTFERATEIPTAFLENGIDAVLFPPLGELHQRRFCYDALKAAEDRTRCGPIRVLPPSFSLRPGDPSDEEPEKQFDHRGAASSRWNATALRTGRPRQYATQDARGGTSHLEGGA